jgi:hypothetical protein
MTNDILTVSYKQKKAKNKVFNKNLNEQLGILQCQLLYNKQIKVI